jgi:hypothetical protein
LPEKVWLRVLKNLTVKDVNNLHLVCRNLHQIANLHANQKLRFWEDSPKHLESLLGSSRIFEELEFLAGSEDHLSNQNLKQFIGFTGPHIQELTIDSLTVDQKVLQNLLNFLPNLRSLELNSVETRTSEQLIKWDLKSMRIQLLKFGECTGFESLLGSLEQCVIRELELGCLTRTEPVAIKRFLKAQEKNLRKFTGAHGFDCRLLDDLKDLQLESFKFFSDSSQVPLEIVKQQLDIKFLRLSGCHYSDETLDAICELKHLEVLELDGLGNESNGLRNIHKLLKLRRLKVDDEISPNILEHLQFGVFKDLEELEVVTFNASAESVQAMKEITPNLKKIGIFSASSDTIEAMLDTLGNLKFLEISYDTWSLSEKVYPKIKHLHTWCKFDDIVRAEQFTKVFPNLEDLIFHTNSFDASEIPSSETLSTESFFVTLLTGLKQLKKLHLDIQSSLKIDAELVLQCIRDYGGNLETYFVGVNYTIEPFEPGFQIHRQSN